jgi:hypothetical protein
LKNPSSIEYSFVGSGIHMSILSKLGTMDLETLMNKMKHSIKSMEKSKFYREFLRQMNGSQIMGEMRRVQQTDVNHVPFQMVLYGLGSIENSEASRLQLALAILMKKDSEWISEIEIYDPVLSPLDREVINRLGCTCLSHNENARRTAEAPTLFYMPHCPMDLYNNVLHANWTADNLNRIVVLGNPLSAYKRDFKDISISSGHLRRVPKDHLRYIVAIVNDASTCEFEVPVRYQEEEEATSEITTSTVRHVFNDFAWHFFPFRGTQNDLDDLFREADVL